MPQKSFRPWLPDHPTLLPTDIRQWLPANHLVWFVLDIVDTLDLSPIIDRIRAKDPRGTPPYDPRMMVALLVYGYAVGVRSSRRIERATHEDVAFRILAGGHHPDHDTIATFRRENLDTFRNLFVQVLRLAAEVGLVTFGVLGLDGVKILANASKHQAMSYDRMKTELERLRGEVDELLRRAEQSDQEEQARYGDGELPDLSAELSRRQARIAKIEAAKAALEAEAKQARLAVLQEQIDHHQAKAADDALPESERKRAATLAEKRQQAYAELAAADDDNNDNDTDPEVRDGDLPSHQVPHDTSGAPKDRAQRNFTDPDSRIMVRDGDHIVQAFNAQAVVDNEHQIIVAAAVGNQAPDAEYLEPMLRRVNDNLDAAGVEKPEATPMAGDAGYFSAENVAAAERLGFDPYISPDRSKHAPPPLDPAPASDEAAERSDGNGPTDQVSPNEATAPAASASPTGPPTTKEAMRAKLQTTRGRSIYAKRKTTPEPVFGQILEVRGIRRFLLRGIDRVRGEWDLITLTHNILKIWRSGATLKPARP